MKKRVLCLLLAGLMLLCTACSGKDEEGSAEMLKALLKLKQQQMQAEPTETEEPFMLDGDSFDAVEPVQTEEPFMLDGDSFDAVEPEEEEPAPTPEPAPEETEAPMYGLKVEDFDAEPMDYGTEDWGVNSYTRAYVFDGMVKVIFGRVEEIKDDQAALEWIAERANANDGADYILTVDLYSAGHDAWMLEYISGGNEDARHCVDVYFIAEDAMHWFHTATPIDWHEDYSMQIERWIQSLYLEQWN